MPQRPYEDVRIEGHLIDSLMVPQIMDDVMDLEGEFEILSFDVGRTKTDISRAVFRIYGRDRAHLEELLTAVQEHGAVAVAPEDAVLAAAPADGVFPDDFYSTTNLETFVRIAGEWARVAQPEMDCGVRVTSHREAAAGVDGETAAGSAAAVRVETAAASVETAAASPETAAVRAETVPLSDVRRGERFVVGHHGIRVVPLQRPRESQPFEFMASAVSSEKPKAQIVHEVARLLRRVRDEGRLTIAVVGPAVVHTGSAAQLARLIRAGYIGALFGGNAVATHDIESNLYGTSLGIDMVSGMPVPGGHEHHLRAINTIRRCGSIAAAIDQGLLSSGLMHTLVTTGTPFVLAGSIRDDGPLPEVITDVMEAQRVMRSYAQRAGACLMLSTMLHSIATGNLLPAAVHTVCVDINPAVVTKLADRGSFQTIGVVTDVGLFVGQLADELEDGPA
jgi:lysine-ketoglutarate reductase/saccharopine dehydrogenase-like protein (TIGR00300 family)